MADETLPISPAAAQPGAAPGSGAIEAMAISGAAGGTGNPPAAVPAAPSMSLFGGLRGGRKRTDGLVPGSPEALEADKRKDRDRKKRNRRKLASTQPPPLPSADEIPVGAVETTVAVEDGGSVPPGDATQAVPWTGDMLEEFTTPLIDAAEARRVEKFTDAATQGQLPAGVVKDVRQRSAYPPEAKATLKLSLPRVSAKLLNKAGISSEWKDEVALVSALTAIGVQTRKLWGKLEETIESNRQKIAAENRKLSGNPVPLEVNKEEFLKS